ncbi:hemagglutinin repeat-containing protein, partial [Variovorax fucosicus]|uniref:hemagglutinin repeat-containing protein n=1 Tax=Variovorax fucosicus TaxID=3053517 RepID=UPI0025781D21
TRTTNTVSGEAHTNTAIASTFSGNNLAMDAGRDINIVGSDVNARGNATLNAVRNVNVVSALEEASTNVESSRTTNGLITSGPLDHNRDVQRSHSDSIQQTVQNERAANITAGGNLSVTAGKQVNVYASNLGAGQDLNVTGQEVTVLSGTNYSSTTVGSSNDRQTAAVTGVPVRMGHGFNNDNSVTNTSTSTTLAAATLSGRNVNITATDGDITLGAAHINATDVATLNATQGDINFNIVRTGTELTQTRGEGDLVYARNRDNGLQTEAANYTQINAGQLTLNAQGINVEVGRNASGSGAKGQLGYVQSVQDALAQQIGQPGMNWLSQIQNDPALANVPINWSSVPLETRHWAEGQGGLTQA